MTVHSGTPSRRAGMDFEALALRHLEDRKLWHRPDPDRLGPDAMGTYEALARLKADVDLAASSEAEGLWEGPDRRLHWVEASGVTGVSTRPGLRRTCTVRKVGGNAAAVASACRLNGAEPPRLTIVTSHLPLPGTPSAGYFRWSVLEALPGLVDIEVVDSTSGYGLTNAELRRVYRH